MRHIPYTPKKCVLTTRKSLKILLVYFWIHGLGLPSRYGPRCSWLWQILASALLAIFFEGNKMYLVYSMLIKFLMSDTDNLVRIAVVLISNALILLQRYFLYSRNAAVNELLSRAFRVYSRIRNGRPPPDVRCALLTLLLVSDIYLTLIITLLLGSLGHNSLHSLEKSFSDRWLSLSLVCAFWQNTCYLVFFYFAFLCLVLKGAFSGLGHVPCCNVPERNRLVATYNELVDVAKLAGEAFHPAILVALMECLIHVFHQSFTLFYLKSESEDYLAYKILQVLFNYLLFVLVCATASSTTSAALDAKYRIRELSATKWAREVPKLSKHQPVFTLLDSIVVDRSLVLTISGALLTYGVMIATLSESSKNP